MKERPIPFSGPMVRAILDGRKTQTRRVVKPQPNSGPTGEVVNLGGGVYGLSDGVLSGEFRCPYGVPGDRLWVRETWAKAGEVGDEIEYRADNDDPAAARWRPSIHMPRWASRLTLEVVSVRVERVQEISAEDCWSEGCDGSLMPGTQYSYHEIRDVFRDLWDSTYSKKPGRSWADNPWVWAVEFKRIERSSDGGVE